MFFTDTVTLDGTRRTKDGYLVASARMSRTGIQDYAGFEVGRPDMDRVRVYRPPEEVFHADSLASIPHKPLTNNHPPKGVTADTWKKESVGFIGETVARDGQFVRVPMLMADQAAIADYEAGKRELSAGYDCELDWTPGTAPDGQVYDAVQREIRINHVALVDAGRAGKDCRIGDQRASDHGKGTQDMTLQKLTVDGISIEMSDTAVQVVSKLIKDHGTAISAKDGEITALKKQLADQGEAIKTKDGEITALKAQIPDAAALDVRAAERADTIGKAKAILGDNFDATGKTDADIRKAVVEAKLGDAAKGMDDAGISGAFKVIANQTDPIRDAMRGGGIPAPTTVMQARDKAYADNNDFLSNAWKGETKGAA